jgi:hypothetical protein
MNKKETKKLEKITRQNRAVFVALEDFFRLMSDGALLGRVQQLIVIDLAKIPAVFDGQMIQKLVTDFRLDAMNGCLNLFSITTTDDYLFISFTLSVSERGNWPECPFYDEICNTVQNVKAIDADKIDYLLDLKKTSDDQLDVFFAQHRRAIVAAIFSGAGEVVEIDPEILH